MIRDSNTVGKGVREGKALPAADKREKKAPGQ